MNVSEFARKIGVSHQAVSKAVLAGRLGDAVKWELRGKRNTPTIVNEARAIELWLSTPGAKAPGLDAPPPPPAKAAPLPASAPSATPPPRPAPSAGPRPPADPTGGPAIPDGDPLFNMATARLQFEGHRALRERLAYEEEIGKLISVEEVKRVFGRQIVEAKTAIMALGKLARSRIPHLTVDDVVTIEDLCREALENLTVETLVTDDPEAN